jgi:hypothetical protein
MEKTQSKALAEGYGREWQGNGMETEWYVLIGLNGNMKILI